MQVEGVYIGLYPFSWTGIKSCGLVIHWWKEGSMENRRFQFMDRRLGRAMPRIPFKDSKGAIIKANRRKIPNRRIYDINVEWGDIYSL